MKLIKGIITYIGVLALIVVGLGMIAAGYLFLFPEKDLFGIKYLQYDGVDSVSIDDASDVTSLSIKAEEFKVIISLGDNTSTTIFTKLSAKYTGFGLKKTEEIKLSATKEDGKAVITLAEPDGLYSRSNCMLEITIPKTLYENVFDLSVSTTKADVSIAENGAKINKNLKVNDLFLSTKKGCINVYSVEFANEASDATKDIYADANDGKIIFEPSTKGTVDKATIITNDGRVYFEKDMQAIINKVVWTNSGVGRLYADKLNIIEANTKGGLFSANEVNSINFFGRNTKVDVGVINLTSSINLSSSGNVVIDHVKDYIEVNNVKGSVNINQADGALSVVTRSGKINIKNATKHVYAESSSGNIYISFKGNINSYSDAIKLRFAQVITKTGEVLVKGVDYILVNSKEGGAPKITVFFHDMALNKQSKINSNGGSVKVITPYFKSTGEGALPPKAFVVKTKTTGKVDLKIHAKTQTESGEQLTYLHGADNACATMIDIDAKNAKIYVRDGQFYEANV